VVLSLTFLTLERFFRQRQRYFTRAQAAPPRLRPARGWERLLIWGWLGLIALFAFLLPLAWLIAWSWEAWFAGAMDGRFWGYLANSLIVAFLAASVAVVAALPVALYHTRRRTLFSGALLQLSSVGFVLPGPVIALGVITLLIAWFAPLYGTLAALVLALVIHFLPLAVQSQESSLQQLTPSIVHAGRVCGAGPLENLWRVILPMMRVGMSSAWVLVFIDALKELPATLLLRPVGFDTLPVRIWIEASEEMLEMAAPAALMLVVAALPALWLVMRGRVEGRPA